MLWQTCCRDSHFASSTTMTWLKPPMPPASCHLVTGQHGLCLQADPCMLTSTDITCRTKLSASNAGVWCLSVPGISQVTAVLTVELPYRAVENLTDMTLGLTAPLVPSSRWQLPSEEWFEQRDAALKDVNRRNTLWRLSSRLFHRVFSPLTNRQPASRLEH